MRTTLHFVFEVPFRRIAVSVCQHDVQSLSLSEPFAKLFHALFDVLDSRLRVFLTQGVSGDVGDICTH